MAPSKGVAKLPAILSPHYLRDVPAEVKRALAASDAEREAATAVTAYLMKQPDCVDDEGPLAHGWACHAAFLAGVRWRERQGE